MPPCPALVTRLRRLSQLAGAAVALASVWAALAHAWFPSVAARVFPIMNPLTAPTLAVAGLSLALAQTPGRGRLLAPALALMPLCYGLASLILRALPGGSPAPLPATQAAVSLMLLGLAQLFGQSTGRRATASGWLGLLALVPPYMALVGYAFDLGSGTPMLPERGLSPYVALSLAALATGVVCGRPERGMMAMLTADSTGGALLRRMAPAAFWAPPMLGWLHLVGERMGLIGAETGALLVTLLMSGLGLALAFWNATLLNQAEAERARIEHALKESEARYRLLADYASDVLTLHSVEGTYLYASPSAERVLGYRPDELLGRSPYELVLPEDHPLLEATRRRLLAGPGPVSVMVRWRHKDGSVRWIESSIQDVPGELPGSVKAMLVVSRDVTDRRQAMEEVARREAELQQAAELARLKDHFLSTLSHEMKTPLSLIVGYSELLEELCPDKSLVMGIQDGARRLQEHIDSMLDYSALLSGTLPLYRVETSLAEAIEAATHITQAGRLAHRHAFTVSVDPATPTVHADPRRLVQILVELLDNACKFTPEGGALGIRARPLEGGVAVTVWDTGPGIRPEDVPRIWEPFGQLAIGDTGRTGGLGLGLTIARKLAELHGGRLEVESQPGRGSRFTLLLPVS